jgi:AcrR family transcriptional regulator
LDAFVSDDERRRGLGPALLEDGEGAERLDLTAERILDAALEQFESQGIRRTSVEAIARRAGVTRMTVYRRFPRKEELVNAVTVREARRMIAATDARITAIADAEERAVEGVVFLLQRLRDHALTQRLLATEPESVLRSLTVDAGPVLALATAYVAAQIRRGQEEGAFAAYEPEPVAELLARFAHSLLLTPRAAIELEGEASLREFARAQVAPIVRHGGGGV